MAGLPTNIDFMRDELGVLYYLTPRGERINVALYKPGESPVIASSDLNGGIKSSLGNAVTADGLKLGVPSFDVGGFSFGGGSITALPNGTWYVGVELSSKRVRLLPRLGHRGWIPVARIVTDTASVTSLEQIAPQVPACRIPRTMSKISAGLPINVVIMGSSLTQSGGGATDWPGMVFGGGAVDKYKLPTQVNTTYSGVGASPNQYQLAQLGNAMGWIGSTYTDASNLLNLTFKAAPNGRSRRWAQTDLVVLGCLANGGDYRLENIEAIIRKLRQQGVEVIVVTDNPQGPSNSYAAMTSASLYVDGPEVMRIAELYGVEVADTAAYVTEAYLRANGVGIYGDTIHQANGLPAGPEAVLPANGHEAWARAVRSIFHLQYTQTPASRLVSNTFTSGLEGWVVWGGWKRTHVQRPTRRPRYDSKRSSKRGCARHSWCVGGLSDNRLYSCFRSNGGVAMWGSEELRVGWRITDAHNYSAGDISGHFLPHSKFFISHIFSIAMDARGWRLYFDRQFHSRSEPRGTKHINSLANPRL